LYLRLSEHSISRWQNWTSKILNLMNTFSSFENKTYEHRHKLSIMCILQAVRVNSSLNYLYTNVDPRYSLVDKERPYKYIGCSWEGKNSYKLQEFVWNSSPRCAMHSLEAGKTFRHTVTRQLCTPRLEFLSRLRKFHKLHRTHYTRSVRRDIRVMKCIQKGSHFKC